MDTRSGGSAALAGRWALALLTAAGMSAGILPVDVSYSRGSVVESGLVHERTLDAHALGGTLPNTADYDWWYGCSPTAAGMMLGYYDRNGYQGSPYDNLIPGGMAESTSHGASAPLAQAAIASDGYIADFWTGYGNSGDDPLASGRTRPDGFNSLADFMGTGQDNLDGSGNGNIDGSTTFWFYTDNTALYSYEVYGYGYDTYNRSGMFGIYEYIGYAGYDLGAPDASTAMFNQYIAGYRSMPEGFTLEQYHSEIDAGRPVLLHLDNHTVLGVGYNETAPTTLEIFDTWSTGPHTMTWGGSYSGRQHFGVTLLDLAAVPVPEPSTLVLCGLGLLGLIGQRLWGGLPHRGVFRENLDFDCPLWQTELLCFVANLRRVCGV